MELLPTNHPTYLARMARILNVHEHVYHPILGRIIAGRWFVSDGKLMVTRQSFESGNTLPIDPDVLRDGNTRDICADRTAPRARSNRRHASRAEQHGRYLDCGPQAWDDR